MLHFRMFSGYIYIQNPVGIQVLNKDVSLKCWGEQIKHDNLKII